MGIQGFASYRAHKKEVKTLFVRKIAFDAFLSAVRQKNGELITNDAGEFTR